MVPNNSPAIDFEFDRDSARGDDDYKYEKIKDLVFVANGKNMSKFNGEKNSEVKWLDIGAEKGKGQELLCFLQQKEDKPKPKKNMEVNWFTTQRGKQVKVNLPLIHTSKDKGTRVGKIKEEEGEDEKGDDTTLVDDNSDPDSKGGGVTIPASERK